MKKLIATIATAAAIFTATAKTENANPNTTPEMAIEAQAAIVAALEKAAADKYSENKAKMPEAGEHKADTETRRAAAHRAAIIGDEINAAAEREAKKLERMKKAANKTAKGGKTAKTRKGSKAKKTATI